MPEQLALYAASQDDVAALLGLGLRDPERAERWWRHALRHGTDPEDRRWDLLALTTRSLLWYGDPELPLDGHPDGYWHGLQAIVASRAEAVVVPDALAVAADLDRLLAEAGAEASTLPRAVSHRPRLGVRLPPAEYVDVRVVDHDRAADLARFWASTEGGSWALRRFLTRFAAEPTGADLWLFSPAMPLLVRRPGRPADAPADADGLSDRG